jgi:uncharacterized protein YdeI (YjbR/CyaY-like superfamily)
MDANFFESPAHFRQWLAENHGTAKEVLVGYHKKHTGKPSLTWEESVREALCYGWIDGIRRSIDADRYTIRFTPRKSGSNWSNVNIKHVEELMKEGRMQAAGLKAFEARKDAKSGIYSYEQDYLSLDEAAENRLKASPKVWDYFQAQAPSYRKVAAHWVMSAKQPTTR